MQYYQHRPQALEARLSAYERQTTLYDADNVAARAAALDAVQQVYQVLQVHRGDAAWGRYLRPLHRQARQLEARLRAADAELLAGWRRRIRSGTLTGESLRQLLERYTDYRPGTPGRIHRGYDALDAVVQGLLRAAEMPQVAAGRNPEMVAYEPTPARVVLEFIDRVDLSASSGFYDLGAGLGHVVVLVHLLTGAAAWGVEIEAPYWAHAQRCAQELGLSGVRFVHRDARQVDYGDARVFFLYTPFIGSVLTAVLAKLERQAQQYPVTIGTFGACTFEAAEQPWLRLQPPETLHAYALAVFTSTGQA